ncbi:Bacterial Fmu (Sun)/eukaryotic nucleolar NOL1/Nop2p [Aphelenchoides avenae]|nr:Bacterial Fmu (Sun)/eukaryotic nucleolar NOL1/Nop2p [Aphelenchus avenae]
MIRIRSGELSSMLAARASRCVPVRTKTVKFKPKIARNKQIKTPSMMALDHFDFYYAPLFGRSWPSIRLGLLTPNKFIAVLNRYSQSFDVNERIIRDLGTLDVIERLNSVKKHGSEVQGNLSIHSNGEYLGEVDEGISSAAHEQDPSFEQSFDLQARLSGGLSEFRPPDRQYDLSDLHMGKLREQKQHQLKEEQSREDEAQRVNDIEITGLEGVNVELPKVDDNISYPDSLRLWCYDRSSIDGYPGAVKDQRGISSWWLLDGGSVVPVLALDLASGDSVFDMCASPGGKSLLMLQTGLVGQLTCNDSKLSRLGQLRRGLSMYVPSDSDIADRVVLKRKDASNLPGWDEIAQYDKVLVDAPCSTDRLSVNQDEGNMFSPKNTKERLELSQLQTRLLV